MTLIEAIGWYAFGLITGILFWEARWRYTMAIGDRLSGNEGRRDKKPFLDDTHKTGLIVGFWIVLGITIIAAAILYGTMHGENSRLIEMEHMTKAGHQFRSFMPAGWYGPTGSGATLNQDYRSKITRNKRTAMEGAKSIP